MRVSNKGLYPQRKPPLFRGGPYYKIVRKITLRKWLIRKSQILRDCLFYILFSTALYSKNDATEHIRIAIALE